MQTRIIIIGLALFFWIPVIGQKNYLGVQGGMGWTNAFTNNAIFPVTENSFSNGFVGGLNYQIVFDNNLQIGADFLYVQKGFEERFVFANETEDNLNNFRFHYNYNYLSVPFKFGYSFGYRLKGFVNIGINPSILVKAEFIDVGLKDESDENYKQDITEKVMPLDLGGLAEIGGSFRLNERYTIFTSFAYQHSIISTVNFFAHHSAKQYGMFLSFGVKYVLNPD